jgi:hypothetical protein
MGEGSSLVIGYNGANAQTMAGGGCTYNNLSITGGSTQVVTFTGSNTFNTFTINAPKTVKFTAGTTTTVNRMITLGEKGNRITISSSSAGSPYTLLAKQGGYNRAKVCDVTDSIGLPKSTWFCGQDGTLDAYSRTHGWSFNRPTSS